MAFNGLPELQSDKVQNSEIYVQKRIYESLKFLNLLPIVQNETGLFTNYIQGEVEAGDPEYTNNGITFNEINFGQGSTVGGQTLPIGYMYKANTRDEQRGRYESNLLSFYNSAVVKISDFFEDKYSKAIMAGGRASTETLSTWDTAENIIDNEVILDDEMRYDANDNATGYAPNTVICNRKDRLTIEQALRKEDYRESNFTYIPSNKVASGDFIIFDANNPGATIEKYADPQYSIVQAMANDGISAAADGSPIPPAFLNVSEVRPNRPQVIENYIWAESNLNMRDSNGFLVIQ